MRRMRSNIGSKLQMGRGKLGIDIIMMERRYSGKVNGFNNILLIQNLTKFWKFADVQFSMHIS